MEEILKSKARQQLNRLISQLADLESCKSDLEPEEYAESKKETIEQLQEFEISLQR
jgi:hypothetical protein